MGRGPKKADIFVEVDRMIHPHPEKLAISSQRGGSLGPTKDQLEKVYNVFQAHGINLHIDADTESFGFDPEYAGTGSNILPYKTVFYLGDSNEKWYDLVNENFAEERRSVFRHCLFCEKFTDAPLGGLLPNNTSNKNTGLANSMTGQYFIIANYEWLQQKGDLAVAGTFMHELGHTLGLNHGGQDGDNYKPNYLSIMNYSFQSDGLYPNAELNYSEYKLADIDETALDEFSSLEEGLPTPTGLETIWYLADSANPNQYVQSPPVDISKALNYNMNNTQDPSPYSMDVNQDKKQRYLSVIQIGIN